MNLILILFHKHQVIFYIFSTYFLQANGTHTQIFLINTVYRTPGHFVNNSITNDSFLLNHTFPRDIRFLNFIDYKFWTLASTGGKLNYLFQDKNNLLGDSLTQIFLVKE